MASINPDLLAKTMKKLGVGRSRVYALIEETVRSTSLPRRTAALLVARDAGVNFSRFATESDLELMRGLHAARPAAPSSPAQVTASSRPTPAKSPSKKAKDGKSKQAKSGNHIFVVHGRNEKIRKALFAFLRSLGLQPIEWNRALALTNKGSPYIGEVIDAAFNKARVVLVLFTPDDEAKLKPEFIKKGEPSFERKLTGQPRPNVLFEAGMAFGRQPNTTILVQVGKIRAVSDVAGRHIVHLSNVVAARQQLVSKLKAAGMDVDDIGEDWHSEGDFSL